MKDTNCIELEDKYEINVREIPAEITNPPGIISNQTKKSRFITNRPLNIYLYKFSGALGGLKHRHQPLVLTKQIQKYNLKVLPLVLLNTKVIFFK
jgi:hypothetical protein